ncbi:uncharacterized protein F5891DRAFT_1185995 [Suillus fuscotomentosus]|uniref:Uncharacterized protein n=1 Tax=Suillus fuscotomentosus TaxID=1912939 RepID=A0AAD4EDC0_9AGAM|nr:uncharacterized protein F5891DRAFT_1185995 [Suillus fuscotomentosus]KAG1902853.1 hypothetical protein F5891DRAFT_1185995 [Suillus fuscotomentosus]
MTAIIGSDSLYNSANKFISTTETRRHSAPEATTVTNNRPVTLPTLSYQERAKRSQCKVPSPQTDLKNEIRTTTNGLASLIVKSTTPTIPITTCAIPTASAVRKSKCRTHHPLITNDIIQHYTDLGHPSSDLCRELLQKVIRVNPDTRCMDFKDVDKVAFDLVSCIIEETEISFTIGKPRLTYIPLGHSTTSKGVIIVEWPSAVHEVPFDEMNKAFTMAFYGLPYDQDIILTTVHMNLSLKSGLTSITPDMSISFTATEGPHQTALIPFIGECTFSQDEDKLFQKLISEVAAHLEVVLVVMVIIKEEHPYHSPAPHSPAWETLRKDAEYLSFDDFVTKIEGSHDHMLSHPVVVAGHMWCKIAFIEYQVWVRADRDEPIDLENHNAECMATGSLFPDMNMDAVQARMNEGLQQMKKYLINMCRGIFSTSELEKANPIFPIHWKRCIKAFIAAAELTVHQCYLDWFQDSFRGTKHPFDETNYVEDDCEGSSVDDCADAGGDDAPILTRTHFKNLPIAVTTLPSLVNGSQSSK